MKRFAWVTVRSSCRVVGMPGRRHYDSSERPGASHLFSLDESTYGPDGCPATFQVTETGVYALKGSSL